jgi:hypothetical protein
MMTDSVGRRSATLRVQGQVRKSNGLRRRQRYQCRGRWFETPQLHPKVRGGGGGLPGFKILRLVETDRSPFSAFESFG